MAFTQQDKDYSCGAAALKYALTFLGKNVGEQELRRASRRGGKDIADGTECSFYAPS